MRGQAHDGGQAVQRLRVRARYRLQEGQQEQDRHGTDARLGHNARGVGKLLHATSKPPSIQPLTLLALHAHTHDHQCDADDGGVLVAGWVPHLVHGRFQGQFVHDVVDVAIGLPVRSFPCLTRRPGREETEEACGIVTGDRIRDRYRVHGACPLLDLSKGPVTGIEG